MNDYVQVIQKTIILSDSLNESIDFIKESLINSDYENAQQAIRDSIDALEIINKALKPVFIKIKDKKYKVLLDNLFNCYYYIEKIIYESENNSIIKNIDNKFYPCYDIWKKYVNKTLKKYTYC